MKTYISDQNETALASVANIVKSSLGPIGMDKIIVKNDGNVTATNDGATILALLTVQHPAARILSELAELQDSEVGDGTTSVVIIAAELLKKGNELIKQKIHPTTVIHGFRIALKQCCKYINTRLAIPINQLGKDCLFNCTKTALNSKIPVFDIHLFSQLVVDTVLSVKSFMPSTGMPCYPIESINIIKIHGVSMRDSRRINGYAIHLSRAAQGMPAVKRNAKIACLDFDLKKSKMRHGVQVLLSGPDEIEGIRAAELDRTKNCIERILKAGANVVLTSKGIDDLALKYFLETETIACRRVPSEDLRKIADATGAEIITTLADLTGGENFRSEALGFAEIVYEEIIADDEFIVFENCKEKRATTILLRGGNDYMLSEIERSLHDGLSVIQKVLEGNSVVPGGGAVEVALFTFLQNFSTKMRAREQLAILQFAEALLVIPKTLAVNAARDATELVTKLCAYHHSTRTKDPEYSQNFFGLDLENGTICSSIEAGILEPVVSKVKMMHFSTEAVTTILRIDDIIMLNKEEKTEDTI